MTTDPDNREPAAALIEQAGSIATATLHEAIGRIGALPAAIKPVAPDMRLAGPAFTVDSPAANNLVLHKAIYAARPGDILVVSVDGRYEAGYWGEIMSHAAKIRDLGGLVIDGCVRDVRELEAIGFPVFSRGLCIRGTEKHAGGRIGGHVIMGDVEVAPGDIMVGDRDGVVAVPRNRLASAVADSLTREAREKEVLEALSLGQTTLEIYGLE